MNWLTDLGVEPKKLYKTDGKYIPRSVYQSLVRTLELHRIPPLPAYPYQVSGKYRFEWVLDTRNGSLFKRLSNWFHKVDHFDLSEWQSRILSDEISRIHEPENLYFEFTNEVHRRARYFYHSSSCWWTTQQVSRAILLQLDGYGVRFFPENNRSHLIGRCFVIPFENGFIVFNGYNREQGKNATEKLAQVLSNYFEMIYTPVNMFCNAGLWINNNSAFVIGSPTTDKAYRTINIRCPDPSINTRHCVTLVGSRWKLQPEWKIKLNRHENVVKATYQHESVAKIKMMFIPSRYSSIQYVIDLYKGKSLKLYMAKAICRKAGFNGYNISLAKRIIKLLRGRLLSASKNMNDLPHVQTELEFDKS